MSSCMFSTDSCWSTSWQQDDPVYWNSGEMLREENDSRTAAETQEVDEEEHESLAAWTETTQDATDAGSRRESRRKTTAMTHYKHVPHRDKPPQLVARRNARERRRVQAVNLAFTRLRKVLPIDNRGKRVSKVKTLHKAIEYIGQLQDLLVGNVAPSNTLVSGNRDVNKENSRQSYNRWSSRNASESNSRFVGSSDTDSLAELLEDFDEDF